jgi:hypothetical protein
VYRAAARYAGPVVVTFREQPLRSVTRWLWARGQGARVLALFVLLALKLTGVIAWSWWWVLAPPGAGDLMAG